MCRFLVAHSFLCYFCPWRESPRVFPLHEISDHFPVILFLHRRISTVPEYSCPRMCIALSSDLLVSRTCLGCAAIVYQLPVLWTSSEVLCSECTPLYAICTNHEEENKSDALSPIAKHSRLWIRHQEDQSWPEAARYRRSKRKSLSRLHAATQLRTLDRACRRNFGMYKCEAWRHFVQLEKQT